MSGTDLLHLFAALLVVSALFAWVETRLDRGQWAVNTLITIVLVLYIQTVIAPIPPEPEPPTPPTGADFGGYRPHFQGFGAQTVGGRGGPVCRASDYGSLAACVAPRPGCVDTPATCARTVVFDASGTYTGDGQLMITSPYLTMAGQTAPSPGVTLANTRLLIDTHDVVVQHLRIRRPPQWLNTCSVGDSGDGGDNSHVQHVIFDHVTCSWAWNVNNYLQSYPGSGQVLVADSLIYEGLWDNAAGGIGAGVGGDSTFVRNVVAHHWSRQPVWGSATRIIVANNVAYNGTDISQGDSALPANYGDLDGDGNPGALTEAMVLWNVIIPGPDSGAPPAFFGFSKKPGSLDAGSKTFFEGNAGPGVTGPHGDGQWAATVCGHYGVNYQNTATCGPGSNMRTNTPFSWWDGFRMGTLTENIRDTVLGNAGARPLDRDAADARVIADVVEGDGTHYVNWEYIQTQYGGMPTLAVNARACQPPSDYSGPGTRTLANGSRNTRLEDWLESDPACGAQRLERRVSGTRSGT